MGQFDYTQPTNSNPGGGSGITINSRSFVNDADGLPTKERLGTSAGNFDLLMKDENIAYKQSGAGAIARTVESKLKEFVSIFDFGAKRNPDLGSTAFKPENDAAIIAANDYCKTTGQTLYLGDYGDVLDFSQGFTLEGNYNVISNGHLRLSLTGASNATFITIGGTQEAYYKGYFKFRELSSIAYSDSLTHPAFTGIRFINIVKSLIDLTGEISLFGTSVEFKGVNSALGSERGMAFNIIYLPICNYANRSVFINADLFYGFVNSNIFKGGGSYLQNTEDPTYGVYMQSWEGVPNPNASINCNIFDGFSFEMGGGNSNYPVFMDGSIADNIFRDFRLEGCKNPFNYFLKSFNAKVRRNFFYPLFNDTGVYIGKCIEIQQAPGTFNVYHQSTDFITQHFVSKFKAQSFDTVTYGSLNCVKGMGAYSLSAGVLSSVLGHSVADAIITGTSFKITTQDRFFGKMIKLFKDDYILINTEQTETDVQNYVYMVPYKNGAIVTHTNDGGVKPIVTSSFVKCLKNTQEAIGHVDNNIMALVSSDMKQKNSHLVWFDLAQVDSVLIMFSRGTDSIFVNQNVTYERIEISTGSNTAQLQTREALPYLYTDNDKIGFGTEDSPLLTKIQKTVNSGGTIDIPAATPIKGIIITGTTGDTISVGTTVSGIELIDNGIIDSAGKFISNDLIYYPALQTLYVSGNTNPITIILPL